MKKAATRSKIDISGYDRSTIIWVLRAAYRLGIVEIQCIYSNTETPHLRKTDRLFVRDVVRDQTVRLIGVHIEPVDAHSCILRVNAKTSDLTELGIRLIRKMVEMYNELILLLRGHLYAYALIEEKHDTITKLISYMHLQLHTVQAKDCTAMYHLFANVDKIADIIKYIARDYVTVEKPMSKTGLSLFFAIHECLMVYEKVYTKFSSLHVKQFSLKRDETKRQIRLSVQNIDAREAFMLGQATCIIEILIDMMESIMERELRSKL